MVRIVCKRLLLLVALANVAVAADPVASFFAWAQTISRVTNDLRFKSGDDPSWAARDLDVSSWQPITIFDLPSREGIYWVRWRVTRPPGDPGALADGVLLKMVASYELYWDGRLIGRNGKVGVGPDDEEPGNVDALFQVPADLLAPGEHVIALRMSSFHTGFPRARYMLIFQWGNFRAMLVERVRTATFSVMAVGGAAVIAVVFGLMWLVAARRPSLLLLTVLALCVAVMQALQAWRWLYEYPYSWHYPRTVAIACLFSAMAVLLPAFVMHHFRVGPPRVVYGALAALTAWAWLSMPNSSYGFLTLNLCAIGFLMAFGLAARAAWVRRRGALVACAGLALSLAGAIRLGNEFLDHAFFLSTGPAAIGIVLAVVLQLRDERREAQQAQLTASRLELELLKKNIQPHFLINTLATIQEVIEREPRTAVSLIDALTGEFRILARVSGEKLIPLGQELELCRAHLDVMSLRKGARCSLGVRGVDEGALVPPALFHTLIENGLTHLLPRDGRLDFALEAAYEGDVARYTLTAAGRRQANADPAGVDDDGGLSGRDGTGLRYIKARLEESFTGRWAVTSGPAPDGWRTDIAITHPRGSGASLPSPGGAAALPTERPA